MPFHLPPDLFLTLKPAFRRHQWPLLALFIVWAAFFSRTLSAQAVYFLDDLKIIFYPLEYAYAEFQSNWSLPVWSNNFGLGQPLMAWGQLGFFTPLHLILRLFNLHPLALLQVSILLYYAFGLVGFYFFLYRWRLRPTAAVLGAVFYVFSGFNVGHLNHVNFYTATMLLPWLFLAISLFLDRPNLNRATWLTIVSALIPLSAQPQISLYTLLIGALYGLCYFVFSLFSLSDSSRERHRPIYAIRVLLLTILSGVVFFGLTSFSTLPLFEFLPQTERAAGMSETELFEFNYPPYHAITLLFPYFFGGHNDYWGAKGFQELAFYTGIIPLVLSLTALLSWSRNRFLRVISIGWLIVTALFIFGYLSPLYRFLVLNKYLTSLSIPARFLYFALPALAVLSAIGLNDSINYHRLRQRAPRLLAAAILTTSLFLPFALLLNHNPNILAAWQENINWQSSEVLLLLSSVLLLGLVAILGHRWYVASLLVPLACVTLIVFGWNYNPLTTRTQAFAPSELAPLLEPSGKPFLPARLYSRPNFYTDLTPDLLRPTDAIGPKFSVLEKLPSGTPNCLSIPFYAKSDHKGTVDISLYQSLSEPPVQQHTITTADITRQSSPTICFSSLSDRPDTGWYLLFTSVESSHLNLYYHGNPQADSTYFIRVSPPLVSNLQASLKPGLHLAYSPQKDSVIDPDKILLERHLNVTASTSGGRWIGALSVAPYREFIETFMANDRDDLVDGDGQHLLVTNRLFFDLAGITHIAQSFPTDARDLLAEKIGLPILSSFSDANSTVRIYQNPQAYPKAWLVPQAIFNPAADETRALMMDPNFNPRQQVFINGPIPPPADTLGKSSPIVANVEITDYQATHLSLISHADQPAWLVVSDLTTPQWQTFIDGQPAPYYVAYSLFKSAHVPAGTHSIEFVYRSPAIERAKILTITSLVITLLITLLPLLIQRRSPIIPH